MEPRDAKSSPVQLRDFAGSYNLKLFNPQSVVSQSAKQSLSHSVRQSVCLSVTYSTTTGHSPFINKIGMYSTVSDYVDMFHLTPIKALSSTH